MRWVEIVTSEGIGDECQQGSKNRQRHGNRGDGIPDTQHDWSEEGQQWWGRFGRQLGKIETNGLTRLVRIVRILLPGLRIAFWLFVPLSSGSGGSLA